MNIVYGGSFNPPTNAHVNIVNILLTKFDFANVIILPVGNSYDKSNLVSFNDRLEMLKLSFNNKRVFFSDIENSNQFLGTLNSLNKLSQSYSNIHFVVGSDNIINIDKWINYELLLKKYPLIIIRRNNDDVSSLMSKYNYLNVKYTVIDINLEESSSLFRSDINKYKHLVNSDVYKYILKNKLFK